MSYKTAAYVYLAALTMTLLFTTSKAVFEIEEGKGLVRKLLNRFVGIVLESESKILDGLIKSANAVVNGEMFQFYLSRAAEDTKTSECLSTHIDMYKTTFEALLGNIKEGYPEDRRVPMYETLNSIHEICDVTLRTRGNTESSQLVRGIASMSLRDNFELEESGEADENKKDAYGFKINKGISEVKSMINILLHVAMDKICKDFKTLQKFGNELLAYTTGFWSSLFDAAPKSPAIQGYIHEYNVAFEQILEGAGGLNIPMAAKLNALLAHSESGSGASSSTPV